MGGLLVGELTKEALYDRADGRCECTDGNVLPSHRSMQCNGYARMPWEAHSDLRKLSGQIYVLGKGPHCRLGDVRQT